MNQTNVIDAAFRNGVKKQLFLGSSYTYPEITPAMTEDALLIGTLDSTNEPRHCQNRQHQTSTIATIVGMVFAQLRLPLRYAQ